MIRIKKINTHRDSVLACCPTLCVQQLQCYKAQKQLFAFTSVQFSPKYICLLTFNVRFLLRRSSSIEIAQVNKISAASAQAEFFPLIPDPAACCIYTVSSTEPFLGALISLALCSHKFFNRLIYTASSMTWQRARKY